MSGGWYRGTHTTKLVCYTRQTIFNVKDLSSTTTVTEEKRKKCLEKISFVLLESFMKYMYIRLFSHPTTSLRNRGIKL